MSEIDEARIVQLEGCLNFRDLGGYVTRTGRKVRWGRLFRSDALHHMTDQDVRRVRDELGVRDVVDLRSSSEVSGEGIGPLPAEPVKYHHMPLFDGSRGNVEPNQIPDDLGLQYFLLLQVAREPILRLLQLIAQRGEPTVYHCAAGKDRTGVVSAVLLGLLGVDEADIIQDYLFTSRNLEKIVARLRSSPSYQVIFERFPPSTLHAEPETMVTFLGRVREEYGSMRDYAGQAGLSSKDLSRLEKVLLED